ERCPEHARWISCYATMWERMFRGAFDESVACLELLAERGYRLHALSNYPAEHVRFLYRRFPFMQRFETVVLSGLLGRSKPDEAIYRYVLERIGGRPRGLSDTRAQNVAAPAPVGVHASAFARP